jgi:hypothetical protein
MHTVEKVVLFCYFVSLQVPCEPCAVFVRAKEPSYCFVICSITNGNFETTTEEESKDEYYVQCAMQLITQS